MSKMIKLVKKISYIMCGLLIYSFIGGLTYSMHEHFYPGNDVRWVDGDGRTIANHDGSMYVSVLWPASIPIWGGFEATMFLINNVFIPTTKIGVSAGEKLINE